MGVNIGVLLLVGSGNRKNAAGVPVKGTYFTEGFFATAVLIKHKNWI